MFFLCLFLPSDQEKTNKIRDAFYRSWIGYKKCAYGYDFLQPVRCQGLNLLNSSLSLIDALDTLWILGYKHDFYDAVRYLEENFQYTASGPVFELVSKVVGGLMSAYQLSGERALLNISEKFMSKILVAFDTPTGLPIPNIDMKKQKATTCGWAPRSTFLSHAGSLSPELITLSMHSKNDSFQKVSDRILDFFFSQESWEGLWPLKIDFSTGLFGDMDFSFDIYGSSFYEYLLKLYIMTDGKCCKCKRYYCDAINGLKKYLLKMCSNGAYVGSIKNGLNDENMSYLSFFIPGMLALGSKYMSKEDLDIAVLIGNVTANCHKSTKTGLIGNEFQFINESIYLIDSSYKLNPEFIESCFYLYRITGKNIWREYGWSVIEGILKYCSTKNGFGELINVDEPEKGVKDIQYSYLFSKTFKYAYLLFSNSSLLSLNEYVFNVDGHPLKHFDKKWLKKKYKNINWFDFSKKNNQKYIDEL